eukprot:1139726-Pelagomonas_calceolata.AAC.6
MDILRLFPLRSSHDYKTYSSTLPVLSCPKASVNQQAWIVAQCGSCWHCRSRCAKAQQQQQQQQKLRRSSCSSSNSSSRSSDAPAVAVAAAAAAATAAQQ